MDNSETSSPAAPLVLGSPESDARWEEFGRYIQRVRRGELTPEEQAEVEAHVQRIREESKGKEPFSYVFFTGPAPQPSGHLPRLKGSVTSPIRAK